MIIDITKEKLINSSTNRECVNFKSEDYQYNYLFSYFF